MSVEETRLRQIIREEIRAALTGCKSSTSSQTFGPSFRGHPGPPGCPTYPLAGQCCCGTGCPSSAAHSHSPLTNQGAHHR